MTYKDFFRLAIRLFGLFGIVSGLFVSIGQLYGYARVDDPDVYGIILLISTVILLIAFFYALILKSDFIVSMLRLDSGFEDKEIPFQNLTRKNILGLSIVFIGLSVLIDSIPDFLRDSFFWLSYTLKVGEGYGGLSSTLFGPTETNTGYHLLRVLVGYLLVSNFDRVSSYLLPKISDQN